VLVNDGPLGAASATVTDTLPAGLTLRSFTASAGTYSPTARTWSVGALASGASATLDLIATVDAGTAGSTRTNVARLSSTPGDLFADNDVASVSVAVQQADLQVKVTRDDATPTETEPLTWSVKVVNKGPHASKNITVDASLPAGIAFDSAEVPTGTYNAGTGQWTLAQIAALDSVTAVLHVHAASGYAALHDSAARAFAARRHQRSESGQRCGFGHGAHPEAGVPDPVGQLRRRWHAQPRDRRHRLPARFRDHQGRGDLGGGCAIEDDGGRPREGARDVDRGRGRHDPLARRGRLHRRLECGRQQLGRHLLLDRVPRGALGR
jgi:uncharacterized repeat protein (TIGR01451 family)